MQQLQFLLFLSSFIAIGAFTLSNIINQPEHILGGIDGWLNDNLPEWIYKPLIGCQYCVAGQWSLWIYFVCSFIRNDFEYRLEFHILFILTSIFLASPITFLYNKVFNKS